MTTFHSSIKNNWNVYKNGNFTGITITKDSKEDNTFYCCCEYGNIYYDFTPITQPSLSNAKLYVEKYLSY